MLEFTTIYHSSLTTSNASTSRHLRLAQVSGSHLRWSQVNASLHLGPVWTYCPGLSLLPPELILNFKFKCCLNITFFSLKDYVPLGRISKWGYRKKKKILNLNQNYAKLLHFYKHDFCQAYVNWVGSDFDPKHQLLYNDYHSSEFCRSFYVNNKPDKHFVVFH